MQGAVGDFYRAAGHPGSWPANWVFAARFGVTPDRFDELFGRVPRESVVVRIGSPADGAVLGRGWSRPGPGGLGRWAEEDEVTLLVTLATPASRWLRLRATSARHPEGREQAVEVLVNGRFVGRAVLTPEGQEWKGLAPEAVWRPGLNEIGLRSTWRLSRSQAQVVDEWPFVGWRLEEVETGPFP
jgi:hypothetical protein